MCAEVIQHAIAGMIVFAPTICDSRSITIPACVKCSQCPHTILREKFLDREEITVPTPILKNRQHQIALASEVYKCVGLRCLSAHRLVYYHMLPGFQGGTSLLVM